ncbi:hypothetical protein D3C77_557220 [compost metagenome]
MRAQGSLPGPFFFAPSAAALAVAAAEVRGCDRLQSSRNSGTSLDLANRGDLVLRPFHARSQPHGSGYKRPVQTVAPPAPQKAATNRETVGVFCRTVLNHTFGAVALLYQALHGPRLLPSLENPMIGFSSPDMHPEFNGNRHMAAVRGAPSGAPVLALGARPANPRTAATLRLAAKRGCSITAP